MAGAPNVKRSYLRPRRHLDPAIIARIVAMYEAGHNVTDIHLMVDISHDLVAIALDRAGIERTRLKRSDKQWRRP